MPQVGLRIEKSSNQNMPDFAKAMSGKHKPVLLHESIEVLNLKPGKIFLDGTYGAGGHSREVQRLFPTVEVITIDQDPKTDAIHINFRDLDTVVTGKVDAILFDLGISTDQLEQSGRGFTFLKDEPLDMRMSVSVGPTASEILNSWDEHAIQLVLYGFGEEKSHEECVELAKRVFEHFAIILFDLIKFSRLSNEKIMSFVSISEADRKKFYN